MKTALIAAAVSAAIAAAGSTAATIVITGKNIKNGTIQLVDISASAKKALRGQRGPRGPSGIQELALVTSPPRLIPPGNASVEATCPAGQQPISGGFQVGPGMTITHNAPIFDRHSWIVIGVNSGPTASTLAAVAYCARNVNVIPLGAP